MSTLYEIALDFRAVADSQIHALIDADRAAADAEIARLREALEFYARGDHFTIHVENSWVRSMDVETEEPQDEWIDEAGTATVEDGAIARAALKGSGE